MLAMAGLLAKAYINGMAPLASGGHRSRRFLDELLLTAGFLIVQSASSLGTMFHATRTLFITADCLAPAEKTGIAQQKSAVSLCLHNVAVLTRLCQHVLRIGLERTRGFAFDWAER